jgi:transposase-like protein
MAAPLSQDLRRRIVQTVAQGSSIRQAAARFEVSPSAAIKLMRRVRATGSTAPARIGGYRRPVLGPHAALSWSRPIRASRCLSCGPRWPSVAVPSWRCPPCC